MTFRPTPDQTLDIPPAAVPEGFRFYHPLRVRYGECDAQRIIFNGSYFLYIDQALSEYFRYLGYSFDPNQVEEQGFDTALVKTTMDYHNGGSFDDIIHVFARVLRIGTKSLTMAFDIRRQDGLQLLTAENVYVNYDLKAKAALPVPDEVRRRVEAFEATGRRPWLPEAGR